MTRYLLDTSFLIDAVRHREPAESRLQAMIDGGDEIGVTPVVVAEFFSGTAETRRAAADAIIGSLLYWATSREAGRQAGIWRYEFARRGRSLGTPDVLIAAVARERQATLVTLDAGDFPMDGITLLDPRA